MLISSKYAWLGDIQDAPKMILAAIALGKLNTTEFPGAKSNPEILALAKEAGVGDLYKSDEVAWCAIAHTVVCIRAGKVVPFTGWDRMRAKSFIHFGVPVPEPMFGDTCVFERPGGFHVGTYLCEDHPDYTGNLCYHIAGGNQGNQYSATRIIQSRLIAARRPIFQTGQPASVIKRYMDASGSVSTNEA